MPLHRFVPVAAACLGILCVTAVPGQSNPETSAYKSRVVPFFEAYCIRCHGPKKSKGRLTLHTLDSDLPSGRDLEYWEKVLDMLCGGEMPPDDERQPKAADRTFVADWIATGIRTFVAKGEGVRSTPTARRLTNFEYQNTMRDLLGFELRLKANLPEDPTRPYRFNNTARYLLMGLEQMDRYEENARRAMASAIVDPRKPKVHKTRRAWGGQPRRGMLDPIGLQPDEISVTGNRNRTVVNGMQVFQRPERGEFRLRLKASAILPPGIEEMPLHVMMGYDIVGIGVGGAAQAVPIATLRLTNDVDHPEVFELRGRVENIPWKPEHRYRRGGKRTGRLVIIPAHFTVTPVNIYDDGTLNDGPDPLSKPRAVVEWIEFEAPVAEVWPPAHHARILFPSPLREADPKAYVREVLRRFMKRAFRRPVTSDEIATFVKVYDIATERLKLTTLEAAMRETLAMVLISPDFLYHSVSTGESRRHYEVASRLSYFLWGSMPDAALFRLAAQGKLQDPVVVAGQVRRLLKDHRSRDFVRNFATQWLALDKLKSVPINLARFPRFLFTIKRGERAGREQPHRPTIRDYMEDETVAFIAELIDRNASLLNIVDSDFAMLNQPLARHYGVVGVQGHELRRVPIEPEHHLGGLLAQGSILIGTGTGSAPHPIYRAVWLREAILGDEVRDPPADVPALEDSVGDAVEHAVSLKDLLRMHRKKESCRDCHARLDPWGIPFERYNAIGRFQPFVPKGGMRVQGFDKRKHRDADGYADYLKSIETIEVEASARVPHGPEVDGMAALKRHLLRHRKDDVVRNIVQRLLSYGLGRDLDYGDRDLVESLASETKKNGYKLQDLIVKICQTDLFLGREAK